MSEQEYVEANRRHWDEAVAYHVASALYDVARFKQAPDRLKPLELAEVGDVRGKTLLHLQCHFGIDSISWARQGAVVTAVDFSPNAIAQARLLAAEVGAGVRFIESDVDALPGRLHEQFDVVFTSYGVLGWLPDIRRWAQVAAGFVKPGGVFYIVEFHPIPDVFDDRVTDGELQVAYPYFPQAEPLAFDNPGTYADPAAQMRHRRTYNFPFTLGDVVTGLVEAGLRIEFLHEFPYSFGRHLPFTHEVGPGNVRLIRHDGSLPLLFSIRATKPA